MKGINMNQSKSEFPWVLFNLDNSMYGISCRYVKSIVMLTDVSTVPNTPHYIRGIMDLRGKIIQLLDLRIKLGLKSLKEGIDEFRDMINKRKDDHVNWLSELEASVLENREFRLTTDPHACAFGKWYDSYQTKDLMMKTLLKKFDEPHKRIHSVALEVKQFQKDGMNNEAENLINEKKNGDLQIMIKLFSALIDTYCESKREIVIVLENESKITGVIVDEILSVEKLLGDEVEKGLTDTAGKPSDIPIYIRKRSKDNSLVIILNDEQLLV
jgi:chemotaxis signal transduction protein